MTVSKSDVIRALVAVLVFLVVLIVALIATNILALFVFSGADSIFPAVSGSGHNENTTLGPQATFWWCFILAAFGAALMSGLAIWDRNFGHKTEVFGVAAALFVVGSASAVNFSANDALIDFRAQAVIDFFQAGVAIAAAIIISRWRVNRPTTVALKAVGLFTVTLLFAVVPLLFGTFYVLAYLGMNAKGTDDLFKWMGGIGTILALAMTIQNAVQTKGTPPS